MSITTDKYLEQSEEKQIAVVDLQPLDKPEQDTKFAHASAVFLKDIITKNNWSKKLGGQSEHIQYEGWQTAGKYYGYTVKTFDAEYIEYGGTWGFKAKAKVINEKTGIEVGGAEALCMSDEYNWKAKPKFQLASMAQTRAGSKALRQILGFVIALAGYSPTPLEEIGEDTQQNAYKTREKMPQIEKKTPTGVYPIVAFQIKEIESLLKEKKISDEKFDEVLTKFHVSKMSDLSAADAKKIIEKFSSLPTPKMDFKFKKPEGLKLTEPI